MTTPTQNTVLSSVPLTERRFVAPLVLITSLFLLWAVGVNVNDILVPHLKAAFGLTDFQSSFIQIAFFGGYFLAAFPAGRLMERIGYKKGILTGLCFCATGALLFLPASYSRLYGFFLFALFIMASGQSFLEVAANPYVTVLGPPQSAERRLNLTQSFNSVGAVLTAVFGGAFILTSNEYSPQQLASLSSVQVQAYRAAQAGTVRIPYLVIAGIFLAVAMLIYFSHLPELREPGALSESQTSSSGLRGILSHRHLVRGVLAQFLYVGAQVGVGSFIIRFAQQVEPGTPAKSAANYLQLHLFGFLLGRFSGSALMKKFQPSRMVASYAASALVCAAIAVTTSGALAVFAIVLIGFFHSIMFPTIFALSIKNLGPLTKRGSSLLVMSIIGGAVFPAIMGRISDASNIQRAFLVPLICYVYLFYFGLWGYKPSPVLEQETTAVLGGVT